MPTYTFSKDSFCNDGQPEFHWDLPDISGVSIYLGSVVMKYIPVVNDSNKKVLFIIDQPNGFYYLDKFYDLYNSYFDLILAIDSYSSKYYNNKYKTNKFQYVPYYIEDNKLAVPKYEEKNIPVFYTGHNVFTIDLPMVTMICNVVKTHIGQDMFNSMNNYYTYNFYRKMEIMGKTRIAIVHCACQNYKFVTDYDDRFIKDDVINEHLPWHKDSPNVYGADTPQLKSRIFEAAISKSIMLCYKDKYHIIDDFYEPNKDFLYFETEAELHELINKVSEDYLKYTYLAENAYKKTLQNYTTRNLVKLVSDFFNLK
jgi:hypothetical protein